MSVTRSSCEGSTRHCARAGSIRAARVWARPLSSIASHGHLTKSLVADVPDQVGIGELLGLDHRVQRPRRVKAEVAHRERLHQIEHDERGDALTVGRDLADLPAPIRRRDGLHPFDIEICEVLCVHRAAARLEQGHDGLRSRALVVAVTSALGDSRERPCKVRVAEDRAGRRHASVDQEGTGRVGFGLEQRQRTGPESGRDLRDRKSFLGIVDGRRQQVGHRQSPEFLAHRMPARDHARHGDRVRAARRQFGDAGGLQILRRQRARSPAARVEAMERARLGLVDERKQIAADAVARGLHQAHHRVGRDGGVDGVAAALEHLHAGAGGQHLAGRDDAQTRGHLRPAGEGTMLCRVGRHRRTGQQGDDADKHQRSAHEILQASISKPDHYAPSRCASRVPQSRPPPPEVHSPSFGEVSPHEGGKARRHDGTMNSQQLALGALRSCSVGILAAVDEPADSTRKIRECKSTCIPLPSPQPCGWA